MNWVSINWILPLNLIQWDFTLISHRTNFTTTQEKGKFFQDLHPKELQCVQAVNTHVLGLISCVHLSCTFIPDAEAGCCLARCHLHFPSPNIKYNFSSLLLKETSVVHLEHLTTDISLTFFALKLLQGKHLYVHQPHYCSVWGQHMNCSPWNFWVVICWDTTQIYKMSHVNNNSLSSSFSLCFVYEWFKRCLCISAALGASFPHEVRRQGRWGKIR